MLGRILDLMERNNISAAKLTKDIGINHGSITDWKKEKAKPSHGAIIKIAKYFGVSPDYILGNVDDPTPLNYISPYVSLSELAFLEKYRSLSEKKRKTLNELVDLLK